MSSTFSRLFAYARSSLVDPKENFTTEALAALKRQDPSPFLRVLSDYGLLQGDDQPLEVAVQTQVPIRGAGTIDLLIELRGRDWTAEVWVEVKVDATERGVQLTNYQTSIGRSAQSRPPRLATSQRSNSTATPTFLGSRGRRFGVRRQAAAVPTGTTYAFICRRST